MEKQKNKIALFVGGTSPEREVSKSTSKSIYKTLLQLGYDVVLVDPAYGAEQPLNTDDFFADNDFKELSNANYPYAVSLPQLNGIELAFLGLHGKTCEDGLIQSLLELKGIKYTGSGVLASSLAMDKLMSKILFSHYDIPTPKWITADKKSVISELLREIKESIGLPFVVKPNDQGSTVGLSICESYNELGEALKTALSLSDKALIEEFIAGRELTVGILDGRILPPLEIRPKHKHYDYQCKYTAGMSEYIVPAEISENTAEQMKRAALKAFNALNCKGYGRADFRLADDNKFYCLEMNTLPGMTATSLVPKMAKAAGITFEELIESIIISALK
jgi:D-alanine-D-alanine ligase